jgi:surface carbohydrate biosynthesis protein
MLFSKNKRPILLLVDNRTRDAHSILLVHYWLKQMGHKVLLANKRNWKSKWRKFKPSVVAMSYSDGLQNVLEQIEKTSSIVVIPQEGAIPDKNFVVNERYTGKISGDGAYTNNLKKIFLWGAKTAKWLKEEEVFTAEQICISGTPRLDPYLVIKPKRIHSEIKKSIGFAISHPRINTYNKNTLIDLVYEYKSNKEEVYYGKGRNIEDFVWLDVSCLRAEFDLIDLCAKDPNIMINIRPQMHERPEGYRIINQYLPNIKIGYNELLWEWLIKQTCIVTANSTSGIEALMLGLPVISVTGLLSKERIDEHIDVSILSNPAFLDYYWKPSSLDEAWKMIQLALHGKLESSPNPEGLAKYLKDFYDWPRQESSSHKIAREIHEISDTVEKHKRNIKLPVFGQLSEQLGEGYFLPGIPQFLQKIYKKYGHLVPLWILDFGYIIFDIKQKNFKNLQLYHFYPWHIKDYRKAKYIWKSLQEQERLTNSVNIGGK